MTASCMVIWIFQEMSSVTQVACTLQQTHLHSRGLHSFQHSKGAATHDVCEIDSDHNCSLEGNQLHIFQLLQFQLDGRDVRLWTFYSTDVDFMGYHFEMKKEWVVCCVLCVVWWNMNEIYGQVGFLWRKPSTVENKITMKLKIVSGQPFFFLHTKIRPWPQT